MSGKPATYSKKLVAQAKKEGSVTLYTTQNPVLLADMAAKFKDTYGISVTINRNIDSVLATQVTAEEGTGKALADIWVCASKPLVLGALKNGWVVDAVGPDLYSKAYDRTIFAKPGKAFVVGEAILGMEWNTSQFSGGLKDLPDVLKAPSGRIGVIVLRRRRSSTGTCGSSRLRKELLQKLAALKPKARRRFRWGRQSCRVSSPSARSSHRRSSTRRPREHLSTSSCRRARRPGTPRTTEWS
jgi:hypothetical protein